MAWRQGKYEPGVFQEEPVVCLVLVEQRARCQPKGPGKVLEGSKQRGDMIRFSWRKITLAFCRHGLQSCRS